MSSPPTGPPSEPSSGRPEPPPDPLGFEIPVPKTVAPKRSTRLTAAAVILLLTGVLAAIGVVVLLSTDHSGDPGATGRLKQGAALMFFALAAIDLFAGILVMRLRPNGRTFGLIAAGIGLLIGLAGLASSPGRALITLLIDGFVAWVLITEAHAFHGTSGG